LNTHLEKRFRFLGAYWAVRGGFNNITGHGNAAFVNNNIDSPQRFTFADSGGRAFTTRIRFWEESSAGRAHSIPERNVHPFYRCRHL